MAGLDDRRTFVHDYDRRHPHWTAVFQVCCTDAGAFGREIDYSQSGTISFLVNILWIVFLGWELAVTAVAVGLVYCVTIIGIPFGLQAFKFARLALMPFGARIVRIS